MFSNKIRILLSIIHILLFIFFLYINNYLLAILMIIGIGFQIYGYFRYGPIWLTFKYLSKQNFKKIKKDLKSIKYPNLLSKNYKGFYHMLNASVILYYDKDLTNVKDELNLALKFGVRTSNNISIIYIMFSQLYTQIKDFKLAKEYLQKAKENPHKEMLNIGLENLEKEINGLENKNK